MGRTKFFWHLTALAVVAVWGVTFVCTKVLIASGLRPAEIFAIRFALAYIGIWLLSVFASPVRSSTCHSPVPGDPPVEPLLAG